MEKNERVLHELIEDAHPLKKRMVSLYVRWNPTSGGSCPHIINCLGTGAFEVRCKHKNLDMDVIRNQVLNLIIKQHFEKKNN